VGVNFRAKRAKCFSMLNNVRRCSCHKKRFFVFTKSNARFDNDDDDDGDDDVGVDVDVADDDDDDGDVHMTNVADVGNGVLGSVQLGFELPSRVVCVYMHTFE
jgi:hypothetical protein